jgi:hypothetical protein
MGARKTASGLCGKKCNESVLAQLEPSVYSGAIAMIDRQ